MGTTLASMHVRGGDVEQVRKLLPKTAVGSWSDGWVSVFGAELLPGIVDRQARSVSKKTSLTVLSAWLFDSDAIGLTVFSNGQRIATHIYDPDGYRRMGNIPLFCDALGLPPEDASRLRRLWRHGEAEEQFELTAALLGLPLCHDAEALPDRRFLRDADAVDRRIAERASPPRIKNTAKVELIQEISGFRFRRIRDGGFYASATPYGDPHRYDTYHLWKSRPDGTIEKIHSHVNSMRYIQNGDRLIGLSYTDKTVMYDSEGLLAIGSPGDGYVGLLDEGSRCLDEMRRRFSARDVIPLGFDKPTRFWVQRGESTVEAWDESLTKPLSRHRLKGAICGLHRDADGRLCVVTWNEKSCIFRIYRLI